MNLTSWDVNQWFTGRCYSWRCDPGISVYASKVYFLMRISLEAHMRIVELLERADKSSEARFSIPMGSVLFKDPFEDKRNETRH